uniref:Uncharacterized protein n=1 Tax=Oryza sativa subsp. japonica TaxID=39947 RepID=Q8H8W0_ORYSJ|nr:hypothetical protein [Oryza sativa Japonica Group]
MLPAPLAVPLEWLLSSLPRRFARIGRRKESAAGARRQSGQPLAATPRSQGKILEMPLQPIASCHVAPGDTDTQRVGCSSASDGRTVAHAWGIKQPDRACGVEVRRTDHVAVFEKGEINKIGKIRKTM